MSSGSGSGSGSGSKSLIRRSSILKPPKPREPLKNVELEPKSIESSPIQIVPSTDGKSVRRVSFAGKKHVKEFCELVNCEGTVWDKTYEESDSGSISSGIKTVDVDSSATAPPSLSPPLKHDHSLSRIFYPFSRSSVSLTTTPSELSDLNGGSTTLSSSVPELIEVVSISHKIDIISNYESILENTESLTPELDNTDIRKQLPGQLISVYHDESDDFDMKNHEKSGTESATKSAENPTELYIGEYLADSKNKSSTKSTTGMGQKSMELIEATTSFENVDDRENLPTQISIHREKCADFTKTFPSIEINVNEQESIENSMELTEVISSFKTTQPFADTSTITSNSQKTSSNKVTAVPEKSVEFNEVIPSFETAQTILETSTSTGNSTKTSRNKFTIIQEKLIELTDAAPKIKTTASCPNTSMSTSNLQKNLPIKMMNIHEISMELTEAIPSCKPTETYPKTSMSTSNLQQTLPIKSRNIHEISMELTEAIPSCKPTETYPKTSMSTSNLQETLPIKRMNIHEISMELTEAIPSFKTTETYPKASMSNSQKISPIKVTNIHEKSMEFTEAIPSFQSTPTFPEKSTLNSEKESQKIVMNNYERSMEFTEAVSSLKNLDSEKPDLKRVSVFRDGSFDNATQPRLSISKENQQKMSTKEITKLHNQSMELTEAIGSSLVTGKSLISYNTSMEYTESIPNILRTENIDKFTKEIETTKFDDRSMDFTENFPGYSRTEDFRTPEIVTEKISTFPQHERASVKEEKLTCLIDSSQPTTRGSVIRGEDCYSPEKNLGNKSAEFTAAVPFIQRRRFGECEKDDSINKSVDKSMEITEAIPFAYMADRNDDEDFRILEYADETLETTTGDSQEVIQKLAENFTFPVPDDESSFDQETFLRQQAQCMQNYEANSTSNQDDMSRKLSTRVEMANTKEEIAGTFASRVDSCYRMREQTRLTICNDNSKGFEITEVLAPSAVKRQKHNDWQDEEPPSFVFSESIVADEVEKSALLRTSPISHVDAVDDDTLGTKGLSLPDITMTELPKSSFCLAKDNIENLAQRSATIWSIDRLDEEIMAFNFFFKTIVLAIYFHDKKDNADTTDHPIKVIGFFSALDIDDCCPWLGLAHSLTMKKVDAATLTRKCRYYEDIPEILDYISTVVKQGMDFLVELNRLTERHVMEIHDDRITAIVRTRDIEAGIILKITIQVKSFEEMNSTDVTIAYILGGEKVKESVIKQLFTNVKKDHRFLRVFMSDVADYLDIMGITAPASSKLVETLPDIKLS